MQGTRSFSNENLTVGEEACARAKGEKFAVVVPEHILLQTPPAGSCHHTNVISFTTEKTTPLEGAKKCVYPLFLRGSAQTQEKGRGV